MKLGEKKIMLFKLLIAILISGIFVAECVILTESLWSILVIAAYLAYTGLLICEFYKL